MIPPQSRVPEKLIYIVFWPEDSTWNDDAISTVDHNRVAFMRLVFNLTCLSYKCDSLTQQLSPRYLTKITDQIICLISDEHGDKLVWSEAKEGASAATLDGVGVNRIYGYEVSKTKDQEEDVTISEGFSVGRPCCWVSSCMA